MLTPTAWTKKSGRVEGFLTLRNCCPLLKQRAPRHLGITLIWPPDTTMLQETTRRLSDAEQRLLRRRSAVPKPGSVYWMRDERRTALITSSICAAILVIGVLVGFPVVGAMVAGTFALMRFSGYRERRRLRRH